jgi:N-acetylglucosamine kinase-like BadF-type ATPase
VTRLSEAVAAQGWAREQVVDNDCFALLRSGTFMPDAVVVVCGAGNNCVGRSADGRTSRFLALGPIAGDWGGGHDLSEFTLRYAARGEDGRGPATALSAAVASHFGRATVEEVTIALHFGDLPTTAIYELSPLLFEVAAAGDPVAAEVVRRQAAEVAALAVAALTRLDLLDEPTPVVLGGGVLTAGHPLLLDGIDEELAAAAPKASTRLVTTALVVGAGLLGLDHVAAPVAAKERLRAAYASPVVGA